MTSAAVAVTLSARRRRQRGATVAFGADRAGLPLHDGRQRHRAAGRREDRVVLHRRDRRRLARLAPLAPDRAAHRRVILDETAERFIDEAARRRDPLHRPRHRRSATATSTPRRSAEQRVLPRHRQARPVLFLEVTVCDPSEFAPDLTSRGHEVGTSPGAARAERRRPERDRRVPAVPPRPHGEGAARLLRVDRGQPGRAPGRATSCSARATSRRSPTRCCAGPSRAASGARSCTSPEPRRPFVPVP